MITLPVHGTKYEQKKCKIAMMLVGSNNTNGGILRHFNE